MNGFKAQRAAGAKAYSPAKKSSRVLKSETPWHVKPRHSSTLPGTSATRSCVVSPPWWPRSPDDRALLSNAGFQMLVNRSAAFPCFPVSISHLYLVRARSSPKLYHNNVRFSRMPFVMATVIAFPCAKRKPHQALLGQKAPLPSRPKKFTYRMQAGTFATKFPDRKQSPAGCPTRNSSRLE